MKRWPSVLRWVAWGITGFVALVVALAVGGYVYIQTETGRQTLAKTVGVALSGPGMNISIGAVDPGFPARLSVGSLVVSDDQGPWLTVDRAVIDWRPLALLSGAAHVTSVDVSGVHLERLPPGSEPEEAEEATTVDSLEIPSLPIDVRVDRIRIRDIALAEAVAGEAMVLDLSGQVAAEVGAAVRTDLRIERTDAEGLVTLVGELHPAAQTLSVDLEVSEPKGGLIARLLGLTPYPPVTVTLKGGGPLNAWRANLNAKVEGLADVTARLRVDHERTITVALEGQADVDGLLDPPLRPLIAEGITFSLSAHLRDLDAVTVDRLSVETKAVSASGSGRVDLAGNRLDATVSVSVPNGDDIEPLLSPLRVGSVAGDVKLSGALTAPTVHLVATVRDMAAPGVATAERLEISAEARLSEDPAAIDARLDGHGLKASEPAAGALTGEKVTIAISGTYDEANSTLRIDRAHANSGPTELSGHGQIGLSTQQVTATLDVTVADVSALGDTLGIPLSGRAVLAAETEGSLETLNLEGSVRGGIPRPSIGHAEVDELLRDGVRLSASYTLAGADSVRFDARVEAGTLLELHAEGRVEDTVAADATLQAGDLSAFSRLAGIPLSGALSVSARAEGRVEDATGTLSATLRGAAVDAVVIPSAELNVNAKDLMQNPSGRLSLNARTAHGPVDLSADFTVAEFANLDLRDLAGEVLGVRIAGNLRAPFDGGAMAGRLQATFEESGDGRDIAGVRVAGRSDLDLRFRDQAGGQTADLSLDASSLAIAVDGGEVFQAERLSLKAALTDVLGAPRGRITFEGQGVGSAAFTASTATAKIDGSLADADFQARMEGTSDPDVRVALAGRYAMKGDTHSVKLRRLDGVLGSHPLKLAQPATVTYAPDGIGVENLSLGAGKGRINANGRLGGARTAATVRITGLPLDLVGQFTPELPLQGTLDADADVRAEGEGLSGTAKIRGRGIAHGMRGQAEVPPVDMDMDAVWRGGKVDINARVAGLGAHDLVATARGPFVVNARSLRPYVDQRAPIAATARWEGQVEPLWEVLPLTDQRLAGLGRIAVDVTGTLAAPRPSGEIAIDKGTYEHFVAGTLIEQLSLRATVDRGQVIKINISGNDGGSGRITGDGAAHLREFGQKPIEVTVRFDQATLVRRDDVTASASGSVTFRGTADKGKLEGQIRTDRVDVSLVDKLPPTVVTLNVIEVHAKGDPRSEENLSKPAQPSQIDLDITLDLPKAVYIHGRGLESEWGGSFRVTGNTGAPRIEGSLSVLRGQFTFSGKRFQISKGVVTLEGGQTIEPNFDVVAEYTSGSFTATISITGPASDPKLVLSSSPPMPKAEILPRVLFGKNSSQLSPGQAAQLALALQGLASGGEGLDDNVLSKIQTTLGIDTLSVESAGEDGAGTAVRIGRHIGDNVYVETSQGTQPGSTVYRVEVEILDNLAVESSVGQGTQDASGFLGLKWEYRY